MCDDCALETAFEADQRYATKGLFDRFADHRTAPHAHLTQAQRYAAEVKMDLYRKEGYSTEQANAVAALAAAGIPNSSHLLEEVSRSYAATNHQAALGLFMEGGISIHPLVGASGLLHQRFEYWSVVMRRLEGFTVKSQHEYKATLTHREQAERAAAAQTRQVLEAAPLPQQPLPVAEHA